MAASDSTVSKIESSDRFDDSYVDVVTIDSPGGIDVSEDVRAESEEIGNETSVISSHIMKKTRRVKSGKGTGQMKGKKRTSHKLQVKLKSGLAWRKSSLRTFVSRNSVKGKKNERLNCVNNQTATICAGSSCTNRNEEEEEILNLSKQIDQSLEMKASHMNLTPPNVKSILRHLIKNPAVLSLLIPAKSQENVEKTGDFQLKLTRAKAKELVEKGDLVWPESPVKKPVLKPRTFLDVVYQEEEDEDEDYDPQKDSIEQEESEVDEESEFGSPFPCNSKMSTPGRSSTFQSPATTNTTASKSDAELMAPPRTPVVPKTNQKQMGLKSKRKLCDDVLLAEGTEDVPCKHTRSKESLKDVPIENFDRYLGIILKLDDTCSQVSQEVK